MLDPLPREGTRTQRARRWEPAMEGFVGRLRRRSRAPSRPGLPSESAVFGNGSRSLVWGVDGAVLADGTTWPARGGVGAWPLRGEHAPPPLDPPDLTAAPADEAKVGAGREVTDRPRNEHLARHRSFQEPRGEVDRNSLDVAISQHAFARVDPGAHPEAKPLESVLQLHAHPTARDDPSNVARIPSPRRLISFPRWVASVSPAIEKNWLSISPHRSSPTELALAVEPTMSTNRTVVGTRFGSLGPRSSATNLGTSDTTKDRSSGSGQLRGESPSTV